MACLCAVAGNVANPFNRTAGLANVQSPSHSNNGMNEMPTSMNLSNYLCLGCYKPMAPLHYQDTTYLVKLWYFKEKTRLIKSIFYFKRHKCRRSEKSLQKLFKGRKAAKSF